MKTKIIPFNKENDKYPYRCPYFNSFVGQDGTIYKIPDCKTATALFIYYHIFYRSLCLKFTGKKPYPLGAYIKLFRKFYINVTDEFSDLIYHLCKQNYKSPIIRDYKNPQFYWEVQAYICSSHKWDWVVPHLRKIYPSLKFMELT